MLNTISKGDYKRDSATTSWPKKTWTIPIFWWRFQRVICNFGGLDQVGCTFKWLATREVGFRSGNLWEMDGDGLPLVGMAQNFVETTNFPNVGIDIHNYHKPCCWSDQVFISRRSIWTGICQGCSDIFALVSCWSTILGLGMFCLT